MKSLLLLAVLLTGTAIAHEPPYKPDFSEIQGGELSDDTQLALYRIHAHIKMCGIDPDSKSKLSILWPMLNEGHININDFKNYKRLLPTMKDALTEIHEAAFKKTSCGAKNNATVEVKATSGEAKKVH